MNKITKKIVFSYLVFITIYTILTYSFNYFFYKFNFPVKTYLVVISIFSILSSVFYFKFKEPLHKLGFFFAAKFFKILISIICAILFLNNNICRPEEVYFFILITYLSFLTFEIIIVLTNLRPVSGE